MIHILQLVMLLARMTMKLVKLNWLIWLGWLVGFGLVWFGVVGWLVELDCFA